MEELIQDSFLIGPEEAETRGRPLAAAVYEKTQGNPFFVNQFLRTLYQDGHIFMVHNHTHHWTCDLEKIKVCSIFKF